jgi:hypothetical protein
MKLLYNFDGVFLTAQHASPSAYAIQHAVIAVDDDVFFIKDEYGMNDPDVFVLSSNLDIAIETSLHIAEVLSDETE